eukprot:6194097-Pleurochrysis_carterae.AAC.4
MKGRPRPTMPVRCNSVQGVDNGAFKHAVLLPDGNAIPWLGKPHHEFISFWRDIVCKWDELMVERKKQGLQV